jgi:S1-C subfamily serine protease
VQFDANGEGLTVGTIEEESIAAQAGLRTGDRIVSIDGQAIANQRQFQAYLSGQYGRRVPVIIERDGRQYTVQLGMQRPSADGAWLGVYLSEQQQEGDRQGARITHVYPSGPAARAGLRPGDVVTQINGRQIEGTPELIAAVDSLEPSARTEFLVLRGQNEVTIPVVLGSRENFVFYGDDEDDYGRRDGFEEGGRYEDDDYGRIPPHAMGLEHDRRMAEQHQRIEMELRKLQEEVRKLREALQARN